MAKSGDKLHIGGRKWVIIMFMGQYEHTIDTKGRIRIRWLPFYLSVAGVDRFCRQADGSFVKPEYKKITASVFIKGYGSYN